MNGTARLNTAWISAERGAILLCLLTISIGCKTFAAPADEVNPGGGEASLTERAKQNTKRVVDFVSGRAPQDQDRAKQVYQQADTQFRRAGSLDQPDRKKAFAQAAELFAAAGESAPESALEQDALFMQAESLFFADELTDAAEVYQKLQKSYPRNRHTDRINARLFAIGQYWIKYDSADGNNWFKINLTDSSRPRIDADGHAIRLLDQIRFDDPTGRLADDATIAAAAEYIRQRKFEEADEFLTDVRETYTDSEHLFLAHMLGIRCKLEVYAGPDYSGLVLEEADKLVRQTRQRFPDRLTEQKYAEMVARAAAEISYLRAERLAHSADYREKRREYRAARTYYQKILEHHGDTPQADIARERLAATEELPAVPKQRLSWLTTIFPDSNPSEPLELSAPDGQPSETILR